MSETVKTFRSGLTVAAVHEAADLSDEAAALIRPDREPRKYVEFLIRNSLYDDAIGVLAFVLPPREAVWWAWSCARDAAGDDASEGDRTVLEATRRWIVEPTDENRRVAGQAAELLEYGSAPAMAGLAAFMCGDTMGPADAPPAPPPPGGAAQAITGSICMAAATGDPESIDERFEQFIARGMERADKGRVWSPDDDAAGQQ